MKASELRAKTEAELNQELSELRRASCALRMRIPRTDKTSELRRLRRTMARVHTVLREKAGAQ